MLRRQSSYNKMRTANNFHAKPFQVFFCENKQRKSCELPNWIQTIELGKARTSTIDVLNWHWMDEPKFRRDTLVPSVSHAFCCCFFRSFVLPKNPATKFLNKCEALEPYVTKKQTSSSIKFIRFAECWKMLIAHEGELRPIRKVSQDDRRRWYDTYFNRETSLVC